MNENLKASVKTLLPTPLVRRLRHWRRRAQQAAVLRYPTPANISAFSVSRLWHFDLFRALPFQHPWAPNVKPSYCDLKVYQDYLMYSFISHNVPKGSRILEVGGGDSRILKHFAREYECWNLDACEGLGLGPVKFSSPDYRIVYDYLGNCNPELPDHSFDLVFSISALEHTPDDQVTRQKIVKDLGRLLKPGCPSFHLFDCFLEYGTSANINGLLPYLYSSVPALTTFIPPAAVAVDPTIFFMSESWFEDYWAAKNTDWPYRAAQPYSMNILWLGPTIQPR